MEEEQYCLKWNNHQSTLLTVLTGLMDSERLADCILSSEGRSIKAHQVVISACSPYLERLLNENRVAPGAMPILIFSDLTFDELTAMKEYMYRGEVNIKQDALDSFLKAASSLQVKGLTDGGGGGGEEGGGGGGKRKADNEGAAGRRRKRRESKESICDNTMDSVVDESRVQAPVKRQQVFTKVEPFSSVEPVPQVKLEPVMEPIAPQPTQTVPPPVVMKPEPQDHQPETETHDLTGLDDDDYEDYEMPGTSQPDLSQDMSNWQMENSMNSEDFAASQGVLNTSQPGQNSQAGAENVVIKTEVVDESYEEFYKSSWPVSHVIKTENIDPGHFVTKKEQGTINTGFISEIKLEDFFIIKEAPRIDAGCHKKKNVQDKSTESNSCESQTDSNGSLNTLSLKSVSVTCDSNVASEIEPASTVQPARNQIDNNITEKEPKSNSKTSVKPNKSMQQINLNNDNGEAKLSIENNKNGHNISRGAVIHKRNALLLDSHHELDKRYREYVKALTPKDMRYPIGNYECYCCSTKFTRLSSWEDHIILFLKYQGCFPYLLKKPHIPNKGILNLGDSSFKFKDCSFVSLYKYNVKDHFVAEHIPPVGFKCALCTKIFKEVKALKKHISNIHNPLKIPFSCSYCNFKTNDKYSLKSHTRAKHTKEGYIKCNLCIHLSLSKFKMSMHMKKCHSDKSQMKWYKCPLCNFMGLKQYYVKNHIKRIHENSVRYYCALCKYETTTKSYLEIHIFKIHMKEFLKFKHKCGHCNKKFYTSNGLKSHQILLHDRQQNRFKCDICNSLFRTKHEYISHGNIEHHSKPELQCDECPFLSQTREEFIKHIFDRHRITFYCSFCPYKVNKKLLLLTHIHNRHDPNAKCLKCSACPYKAKNKGLLKQHFNIKHNPNAIVYTCFHCNHTTKIKHKLSQHMQVKHLKLLKRKKC